MEIGTLDWGYCEVHLRVEEVPQIFRLFEFFLLIKQYKLFLNFKKFLLSSINLWEWIRKIHLNQSKIWKYDKLQWEFKKQFFYYYKPYHEIYKTYI